MLKILIRYLYYRIFSRHRKGFGVHSPFVYNFIRQVLMQADDPNLKEIIQWRGKLKRDTKRIRVSDFGEGSLTHKNKARKIRDIEWKSSINHKYGRVLYYLVREYRPNTVIELGTGIGISTIYLAKALPGSIIFSIEKDREKIEIARMGFREMGLKNITIYEETFRERLPTLLKDSVPPVLLYLDGDHAYDPTLEYFSDLLKYSEQDTIFVLDDIRWSSGMERAWKVIKANPESVVSLDLFFMGIVFFRKGLMKQSVKINF